MNKKQKALRDVMEVLTYSIAIMAFGAFLLFSMFLLWCCVWFGMNPVALIQAGFFQQQQTAHIFPENHVADSDMVLNIGDIWTEADLFSVQVQSIQEFSLEEFESMKETQETIAYEEGMRACLVTLKLQNKNYSGTQTSAYGNVQGMYAIVHASGNKSGPLPGSSYGLLGIAERDDGSASAIPKGETRELTYAFLIPKQDREILLAIQIPEVKTGKTFYQRKYRCQ